MSKVGQGLGFRVQDGNDACRRLETSLEEVFL